MPTKEELMKKAEAYGREARAYGIFEKNSSWPMTKRYREGKEAANQMANMYEQEAEAAAQRAINSREQYMHERNAGDPNALRMSYEEWKKL